MLAASRTETDHSAPLRQALAAVADSGTRIVSLGSTAEGIDSRTVGIDNVGGTRELGAALAALGYREALVLASAAGVVTSDDRATGFADGFTSGGGADPRVLRGSLSRDAGYALMREALERGVAPGTVVFGISDVVAFGAMSAIRDAGREIGTDLAVAGFGDVDTGRDIVPSLTTARAPLEALGHLAVDAIVNDDWTDPGPLPVEIIVRDSTPSR